MNEMASPSVAIIILNWNNWQDTVECLESISLNDYLNYRIIVVDNGSADDSVAQIGQRFKSIQLLETGKNLGFSGGVNFGIERAKATDLILLLNNDTLVDRSFLTELVRKIASDPAIGLVGGKIYHYDSEQCHAGFSRSNQCKIWSAGGGIHQFTKRTFQYGEGKIDRGQWDREREVDFLSGCCLLVRRDVIEKIGLLDPDYFMYYEDVDFCVRAKKAGFKICFTPKSVIWHKVSKSSDKSERDFYRIRNAIIILRKQFGFSKLKIVMVVAIISMERLLRMLARKFILFDKDSITKRAVQLFSGTLNGLRFISTLQTRFEK
ncbi:MAG: glycosyltransferase family 2 protein [Candidatus Zhuqueibacterota bacterium]